MSQSNVSREIEREAKSLRSLGDKLGDSLDRFRAKEIAGNLEKLAEPRGGVELAHVCGECGCIVEDDEVETIDGCENCGQPFYEID